jgi:glycosyltransferase involved in cell wall biosynthesis
VGWRTASIARRTSVWQRFPNTPLTNSRQYFGRQDVAIVPDGVDIFHFSPTARTQRRPQVRQTLSCPEGVPLLLLVGNELRNKGLPTLLQALTQCRDLSWHLCVVGSDSSAGYSAGIEQRQLQGRVTFAGELPTSSRITLRPMSTSRLP